MGGPKRVIGFMAFAKDLISSERGLTAKEVYSQAKQYSADMDIPISASATPEASLVATLHKTHRDYGLERKRGKDGRYRFYLKGYASPEDPVNYPSPNRLVSEKPVIAEQKPTEDGIPSNAGCCIELPSQDLERIRAFVVLGKYANEHEAHCDLVKRGLEAVLAKLSA